MVTSSGSAPRLPMRVRRANWFAEEVLNGEDRWAERVRMEAGEELAARSRERAGVKDAIVY